MNSERRYFFAILYTKIYISLQQHVAIKKDDTQFRFLLLYSCFCYSQTYKKSSTDKLLFEENLPNRIHLRSQFLFVISKLHLKLCHTQTN